MYTTQKCIPLDPEQNTNFKDDVQVEEEKEVVDTAMLLYKYGTGYSYLGVVAPATPSDECV